MLQITSQNILGGMRTNNSLEGIHNRINKFFDTNNPTIWNFIDKLRSFDESIYSDVLQWNNGLEPSARKKWSTAERAKVAVLGHYGQIGNMDYLRAVANQLAQ
jgi:hypothetical protein